MGFSPIAMPSNQLVLPRCWFDPHLSSGARKNSGIPRPAGNPWVGRMLTSEQCVTETQLIYAWREPYIILSNLIIILYMCLGMGRHVFCWISCISIRLFPTCELNCPGALGWIGTSLSYSAGIDVLTRLLCYKGVLMSLQTLWLDKRLPIFWKTGFHTQLCLSGFDFLLGTTRSRRLCEVCCQHMRLPCKSWWSSLPCPKSATTFSSRRVPKLLQSYWDRSIH